MSQGFFSTVVAPACNSFTRSAVLRTGDSTRIGTGFLATYDEEDVDILYGDVAPREDFQIFKLIALKDYTMKEAADEFGISVEACKKRVQRIRNHLRKKFPQ